MTSRSFSLKYLVLGFAAGLTHCTKDQAGDPCSPPVILEISEANTGNAIATAQIQVTNLDRAQDSSIVEWDSTEMIYRISGSAGTYRIFITHPEYQDVFLDSLKVEEAGNSGDDYALKTLNLRIDVSRRNDSVSLEGKPFRVKEVIAAPRC